MDKKTYVFLFYKNCKVVHKLNFTDKSLSESKRLAFEVMNDKLFDEFSYLEQNLKFDF
jgi:hypothetical protein